MKLPVTTSVKPVPGRPQRFLSRTTNWPLSFPSDAEVSPVSKTLSLRHARSWPIPPMSWSPNEPGFARFGVTAGDRREQVVVPAQSVQHVRRERVADEHVPSTGVPITFSTVLAVESSSGVAVTKLSVPSAFVSIPPLLIAAVLIAL